MPHRSPIAVVALLGLTNLVTIALFVAGIAMFSFDGTNFFAMFILPIGAIMFGLIGALGAVPGARIAQYSPGSSLRTIMAASSAVAFAVYLLVVAVLINWADPAHPGVIASLLAHETAGDFRLTRGTHEIGNLGQVGAWGYLLLALKFAGAALGAVATHEGLRLLPYCRACQVFTRTRDKGTVHFLSFEAWAGAMNGLPEQPWLRARDLLQLPRQKAFSVPGRYYVLVRLRRHECPTCREQHMRERVFVHNGRVPVEQKELSSAYSWSPSEARSRPAPPPVTGSPRGFGRKVA